VQRVAENRRGFILSAFIFISRLFNSDKQPDKQGSDDENSSHFLISRLDDTASALAVYASGRPFGRLRKTRFQGSPAFSGWDSSVPTQFL